MAKKALMADSRITMKELREILDNVREGVAQVYDQGAYTVVLDNWFAGALQNMDNARHAMDELIRVEEKVGAV